MPELDFDDESRLQELILDDLDEEERELFTRVHRLDQGCALMGFLDDHPNQLLTLDDLAFHVDSPRPAIEHSVQELARLGLLRHLDASNTRFWGLIENPDKRREVHDLFNWQRGWHTRLSRIQNLVNGHLHK